MDFLSWGNLASFDRSLGCRRVVQRRQKDFHRVFLHADQHSYDAVSFDRHQPGVLIGIT